MFNRSLKSREAAFIKGFMQGLMLLCVMAFVCIVCGEAWALDRYELDVDSEAGTIAVRGQLGDIQSGETICLPAFGQRYGETFSDVGIYGSDHAAIDAQIDSYGCYRGITSETVHLEYRLGMQELGSEKFWLPSELSSVHRDGMLIMPGESLFCERGANQSSPSHVETEVKVTSGGQTVTTLVQTSKKAGLQGNETLYRSSDAFELTRSYWGFGAGRVLSGTNGGISWEVMVDPKWRTNVSALERELSQIIGYYAQMLPNRTRRHIAVFLMTVPFDADYHHGIARPGGVILELGQKAAGKSAQRRILMAHELFHLYNGEGLRFDATKYAETAWFREGMTQYMAMTALLSLGLMTRDQLYDWMGKSITKQGSGLYDAYHHGFFLSLAIEQQWQLFGSDKNMQGFWQYLGRSSQYDKAQTNLTIRTSLEAYSTFDFGSFFQNYVKPHTRLPIESILSNNGLSQKRVKTYVYSTGIEYGMDAVNAQIVVKGVVPGSTGYQAGVRPGDIIVPDLDTSWEDNSDKRLVIIRGGRRTQMRIPVTPLPTEDVIVY